MDGQITRYAVLRDGQNWDGLTATDLQAAPDGVLTLARVPGPADGTPIEVAGPFDVLPSGLAAGDCGDLYIADTARRRVIWIDGVCGTPMVVPGAGGAGDAPGHFREPRGLLIGPPGGLYVADSGNARVQLFRLPSLEVHAIWTGPLHTPTGLARDSQNRVYVLDRGLLRVLRFSAWGQADAAYNTAMAAQADLVSPAFLAIDADDILYVADDANDTVWRFDAAGQALGALPAPTLPWRPRALATHADRIYIADAASGSIYVFDRQAGHHLGTLPGYRGPVAALMLDATGALIVKPGPGETVYHLAADLAFVSAGQLTAGPFDAGERSEWTRVAVRATLPTQTTARLQTFLTDAQDATPTQFGWTDAPALDMAVVPLADEAEPTQTRRFLWLRVFLASNDPAASPRLTQIQAETAGQSYLSYLPAIYRREDAGVGFLKPWLELFRSELGDLELLLEDMARRFDPAIAPEDHLSWLASWLGFDLPANLDSVSLRELLLSAQQLYSRRGTPFGLRRFIQLYAGVQPQIFEAFQERHIWQLGYTSALGFDTALPPVTPDGIIVPDTAEALVIGETVVGQSGPLAAADQGEPLFSTEAYRFTVLIAAAKVPDPAQRLELRRVIEAEKPAYADYHLCFVEARMRVGFQSRIGLDSIVAGPPDPMQLTGAWLGLDSVLGEGDGQVSRVGQRARVGRDTTIG